MRILTLILVLGSTIASAQEIPRRAGEPVDTWSEPNPGVRYLRRTVDAPAESIHAVIVDLSHDGVRVVATPQSERWSTVSDFARSQHASVAVNGGFWGFWQRPTGITAGAGELWNGSEPDPEFGHFGVRDDGRAVIRAPGEGEDEASLAHLSDAVSGRPILVLDGAIASELDTFTTANQRQPRTAVGVSANGRTVIIVVVDGRQSHSRGLTLYELARLMVELGAVRAINLDGGGSSAMYVEGAGGLVSSPSRSRVVSALGLEEDAPTRGMEREVMNHLAVIAPAHGVAVSGYGDALADGLSDEPVRASIVPSPSSVRIGRARELVYPLAWLGLPVCPIAGLVVWRWRKRRSPKTRACATIFAVCPNNDAFGRSRSPVSSFRGESS